MRYRKRRSYRSRSYRGRPKKRSRNMSTYMPMRMRVGLRK